MNNKPLITFVLLSYNQEPFIREALNGALSQTYSPLEIIISDDFSVDRTFQVINEVTDAYQGPHHIILNRNDQNLGIGGHINRIMELAQGDIIVVAAGDDISIPDRVEEIYKVYASTQGKAKSIFSNNLVIDVIGNPYHLQYDTSKPNDKLTPDIIVNKDSILSGCSHAWSREVFTIFGPLMTPLTCEDMVIPFRSALLGEINYIDEALVMHRQHGINLWNYKWHHGTKINVDRELEFEKFWIFERQTIYKNWLKDLQIMEKIAPSRIIELRYLQDVVYKRLLDIEERILMLNEGFMKKVMILAKNVFKNNIKLRNMRHDIGFFLMPRIYRSYMIYKSKIRNI